MADVVGYFLTWTTYGTWLPGDDRGWHDWRQGWKTANPKLAEYSRLTMTEDAITLTDAQRKTVEATIEKHCQIRKWHLHDRRPITSTTRQLVKRMRVVAIRITS